MLETKKPRSERGDRRLDHTAVRHRSRASGAAAETSLVGDRIGHSHDLCGAGARMCQWRPLGPGLRKERRPDAVSPRRVRPLPRCLANTLCRQSLPSQAMPRFLAWPAAAPIRPASSRRSTGSAPQSTGIGRHRHRRARGGAAAAAGRRAGHAPRSRAGREPCSCRRSGNRACCGSPIGQRQQVSVSVWMYLRSFTGITSSSAGGT